MYIYVHTFGFVSTKHHIRRGIHLLEPLKPKLQGPMRWHQMDRKTVPFNEDTANKFTC